MLESALHYASLGLSVIPVHGVINGRCTCGAMECNKPGKHPRTLWKGSTKKTLSADELKSLWERFPGSNVGIVTGGVSGIAVIDIDAPEGIESLKAIGLDLKSMPATPTAMTGGGGYHLIYKMPDDDSLVKTKAGLLKNVDIRANGGQIVAPPSMHASGVKYAWYEGRSLGEIPIAEFDFSLLYPGKRTRVKVSSESLRTDAWYESYLNGVNLGGRNSVAARLAGRYFALGLSEKEIRFFLSAWNQANEPPMTVVEMDTIVKSIRGREAGDELSDPLEAISSTLKMKVLSICRITGDEPQIIIEFDRGKCTINTQQLLSPTLFQQAVAEATKVVIRRLTAKSTPTHNKLSQLILDCCEDLDAGAEATGAGEMIALLKDFIKGAHSIPNVDDGDEIPISGSFREGGLIWISLEDLVQRGGIKWNMRISLKSMAQRIKAMGIDKKVFSPQGSSARTLWGINPVQLEEMR